MRHTVDYFLAPQSPWTYLGHERFAALVRETGSAVRVLPMDLGKIFPLSGGLLPYVARDIYGMDQSGLGFLAAGFASGGLIGSLML